MTQKSNITTELNVFDIASKVQVDWDYALEVAQELDVSAAQEGRLPLDGKTAIRILAEYGAIAHHCAFAPKNIKMAIVISPPFVWFCPSKDGLHGVFVEEYKAEHHGTGVRFTKKADLFAYTNIDARLDAWSFYAQMLSSSELPAN